MCDRDTSNREVLGCGGERRRAHATPSLVDGDMSTVRLRVAGTDAVSRHVGQVRREGAAPVRFALGNRGGEADLDDGRPKVDEPVTSLEGSGVSEERGLGCQLAGVVGREEQRSG